MNRKEVDRFGLEVGGIYLFYSKYGGTERYQIMAKRDSKTEDGPYDLQIGSESGETIHGWFPINGKTLRSYVSFTFVRKASDCNYFARIGLDGIEEENDEVEE